MEAAMKHISILLILSSFVISTEWLHAQMAPPPPNVGRIIRHFPRKPGPPRPVPALRRDEATIALSHIKNVVPATCSGDAQAYGANLCGYVNVPLDREHPKQGKIAIYFELYLHSGSGPAESAILVNHGGPGISTSGFRGEWLFLFGTNLDVHDLLLIDDRGRGLSDAIDCEELQHGTGVSWDQETADCAAQLGNAASLYGTGDIAKDTDAVRAALGYDKVDYFGPSYGGADVTAYATRFGEHLRSIVLDAPAGTPGLDKPFVLSQYRAKANPSMVSLDCQRSPTCVADHPLPEGELDALIRTVRLWPVEGDAYDANGNLMHVRIDESGLLNYVIFSPTGNFASTGEILAAAHSLWQGDSRPLLRLGAEG
jgi:pimeloyl-ACP methyl ester carboxylesterase